MKQQELDTTKILLTQSHEKIEELEKKFKDAKITYDRLQEDIKRFVRVSIVKLSILTPIDRNPNCYFLMSASFIK